MSTYPSMAAYPSLAAYNADVIRAREAYASDMRVEAGYCESGDGRVLDIQRRQCWSCRKGAAA